MGTSSVHAGAEIFLAENMNVVRLYVLGGNASNISLLRLHCTLCACVCVSCQLRKVNITDVSGLQGLRGQLESLSCERALKTLKVGN